MPAKMRSARSRSTLLAIALMLSACEQPESSGSGSNVTGPKAAAAEPSASSLNPGRYRQVTTLIDFNDPALPPAQLASARKQIGTSQSDEQCVSREMVADPKQIIQTSLHEGCAADRLTWEMGKIDVAFACPAGSEFEGAAAGITGSYSADGYSMELVMKDDSGKLARLRVDAQRLGDC